MPDRRRRATPTRVVARRRAEYLAVRFGRAVRESRIALGLSQARAARAAGVSQGFWSRVELGSATVASLETLAACAAAVDTQLAAFIEARPGASLPRDIEHVRRQELVVRMAGRGGWRAHPERPIDPQAAHSRSVDVLLERTLVQGGRQIVVVEIEDLLADIGAVFRGLEDKVATVRREFGSPSEATAAIHARGLLVVRATRGNRTLMRELGGIFRARFPAPSGAWLRSLTAGGALPDEDGLVWSSVRGDRLFEARPANSRVAELS